MKEKPALAMHKRGRGFHRHTKGEWEIIQTQIFSSQKGNVKRKRTRTRNKK